jgi:dipeptidyl aminopeptidase/acylaminoacyl peptidase
MDTESLHTKRQPAFLLKCHLPLLHLHLFYSILLLVYAPFGLVAQTKRAAPSHDQITLDSRTVITRFFERQAKVRYIYQTVIHPDASALAWCADGPEGSQVIYLSSLARTDSALRISAASAMEWCSETEPQWSLNGREIAFLSDARSRGQLQVFIANAASGKLVNQQPLTQFDGHVSHLKWSPDGRYLSVLYVAKASREPSPMAAENRAVGLIDSNLNRDIQRIAVIDREKGTIQESSPSGLYIYEYDWSPDSKQFVYTAAPPPGDDNWYIAQLYKQPVFATDTVLLYKPLRQIALPRWSVDGKRIAFIEALMSDQGGIGGEIFSITSIGGDKPQNLTPKRPSTPAWFTWRKDSNILFTEFVGGSVAVNILNTSTGAVQNLWREDASIRASSEEMSLAVADKQSSPIVAFTHSSWNTLPEVYCGTLHKLTQTTHLNTALQSAMLKAENIEWMNEGFKVQGWLLYPQDYVPSKKYPMLVCVHGGPAWITTPTWSAPDFNTTVYTQLGYFVFFPNPRGSYGQGEAFTLANRRDWGFGDLRDILRGIDTVVKKLPVDNNKVGILGWSYGGAMSMFAITQTARFKAAVAGAGAADWQSYYGQNRIDKWMRSYFGASPYDDPAVYAKCSAMTYIKNAKTPTLVLVGERDGEAPPPQSFQFWHALKELNVPTQLVVYADEGHAFEKFENMIDVSVRTIEWFNKYMGF